MKIFVVLFVVFVAVSANCGCLKCNPDFKSIVAPGPRCPVTIVYKDSGVCPIGCPKPLPYTVQAPVLPPPPPCGPGKSYGYQLVVPCQEYFEDCRRAPLPYQVQAPVIPPVPCPIKPPLTGLEYCTDTVVLPSPYRRCPQETCVNQPGKWLYQPGKSCAPIPTEIDIMPTCSCRYEKIKSRQKRDLPIIQHGVKFMVGLLPPFIKDPIKQTVKMMNMHGNNAKKNQKKKKKLVRESDLNKASYDFMEVLAKEEMNRRKFQPQNLLRSPQPQMEVKKPLTAREKAILLEKLKKVAGNKRSKRSIIIGSDELSLPFFEVKDDDESSEDYEDEDEDEEIVGFSENFHRKWAKKRQDLEDRTMARHPLLYLIKAPMSLLKQFHEVKQTLDPVLKEGAQILGSSKQYFKDFHKNFQSGMLNLASNVIGDFDGVGPKSNYLEDILRPARRYRRDLQDKIEDKSRQKRYILKVVDEDEVQEFLKEKLGDYIDGGKTKKAKKSKVKDEDVIKKIMNDPKVGGQMKVEKLKPKIIIDNNGVPFMEMNGVKRPLGLKRRKIEVSQETPTENENTSESENEKTADKLSDLIQMARERVENGEPVVQSQHVEMPVLTIKEKITATLTEVDNLINMDFDKYGDIYDQLLQAQNIKTSIVEDWRKILMERKINDIASKLSLLDKLKELQEVKDGCVHNIAKIMPQENHFMTKTWIIVNIRLQKLQCLITRVVDEFSERLKANIPFNVQREIKYVDLLSSINLVYGLTRNDNLNALRKARDENLQEEMTLLENLRKLLLTKDTQLINETAATLWEMKNIEKLEKDTIQEINKRIDNNQKIKKELKIIFDLEKQWDQCNIQLKTSLTTMKTTPKTPLDHHQTYWLDKYRKNKT